MKPDKVIYTDGRDVVVTDSTLKVKNTSYRLNGITKLCLWTIRADRWPGILLLLIGLAAAVCGYMGVIPGNFNLSTEKGAYSGNMLALWAGAALILIGIFAIAITKERYAVRIGTAEGDKDAVVSTRREYISQIVDAIHSAFDMSSNTNIIVVNKK